MNQPVSFHVDRIQVNGEVQFRIEMGNHALVAWVTPFELAALHAQIGTVLPTITPYKAQS